LVPRATPPRPQGFFLAALLTLIALVPFGAVLGYVVAVKFGQDRIPFALFGALLGALAAWWKRAN
jgi:uncharacterized Tic20 family protein